MKILFIGDVFGRPGRNTVKKYLPELKQQEQFDLVIANAENMHHGKGMSHENILEMQGVGVDFFTSGNHVWKERAIFEYLDREEYPLVRPANYADSVPGKGYRVFQLKDGRKVLIINLIGRVFMHQLVDCPFRTAERILMEYDRKDFAAVLVDFHAETSSEKVAFGHFLDGKVDAVVGTHTHVPTADEMILEHGTAYQTDLGMTGAYNSVIGLEKTSVIKNFLDQMPFKHEPATGPTVFNSTCVEIDDTTGKVTQIRRIQKYFDSI